MFRIRPLEKILTAGEYHCCENGKTPTEYNSAPASAFTEVISGVGNRTTTWTMDGTQTSVWEAHFKVCCTDAIHLTMEDVIENIGLHPAVEVYFGPVSYGNLIYSEYDVFANGPISVDLELEAAAADFFPIGPCGLQVMIVGYDMDGVDDNFSISL